MYDINLIARILNRADLTKSKSAAADSSFIKLCLKQVVSVCSSASG